MARQEQQPAGAGSNEELARTELDALAAEHDEAAEEFQPGEAGQPAPADTGNAQTVSMVLEMAVAFGKTVYPSLETTASQEQCQKVAASVGAVLDKYNVQAGGWLSQYGTEIAALVSCASFGAGVYAGIKADIAAREAEASHRPARPVTVTEQKGPELAPADPEDPAANLPGWQDVAKA